MIEVKYSGKIYKCETDFAFIELVEQKVNMFLFCDSLSQAFQKIPGAAYRLTDVAWVVYAALSNAGCRASFLEVGDAVRQDLTYVLTAFTLITDAVKAPSVPEENDGKKKPDDSL